MILSPRGMQVLIDREGCSLTAYQDSVGVWTVGVGHAATSGTPPIPVEGMVITEKQAWQIFEEDTDEFEEVVNECIEQPMETWEFDAFVSICFNIGGSAFRGATFVERFNADESKDRVTEAILFWNQPSEIIPRRQGEAVQFRDNFYVARIDPMPPPA